MIAARDLGASVRFVPVSGGARVLVRNDAKQGYNGVILPEQVLPTITNFTNKTGLPFVMFCYGVGDHGGGPTRRDLAMLDEMNRWPIFPRLTPAKATTFFERLEREGSLLPSYRGELNTELTGCYTTQALIKRCNRIAEYRLLDAESSCWLAERLVGEPYPEQRLRPAWRATLLGHFHDILPGSNVHDSRTYFHGQFQESMATLTQLETTAMRAIAARVDTATQNPLLLRLAEEEQVVSVDPRSVSGAGAGFASEHGIFSQCDQSGGGAVRAVVVFNPTVWSREEVVEMTLWLDRVGWTSIAPDALRDQVWSCVSADGRVTAAQHVRSGTYWNHNFITLAFPVHVPATGYQRLHLARCSADELGAPQQPMWLPGSGGMPGPYAPEGSFARQISPPHHCPYLFHERRAEGLENDRLRIRIDPMTGGIVEFFDKQSGCDLVGQNPWRMVYEREKPHGMSAWLIDHVVERRNLSVKQIERKLDGPHKASVEVHLSVGASELTAAYTLHAGEAMLRVQVTGTWLERGGPEQGVPSLRFEAEINRASPTIECEVPFGAITRSPADAGEVPALNWVYVHAEQVGLLVLNDSKHGFNLTSNTLGVSLIRSAYAPDPLADMGRHEFTLALAPVISPNTADFIRIGKAFNRPLRLVGGTIHSGDLPPSHSELSLEPGGSVVLLHVRPSSIDPAETVMTLLNLADADQTVTFRSHRGITRLRRLDADDQPFPGNHGRAGHATSGQGGTLNNLPPGLSIVGVTLSTPGKPIPT